MKNRYLKISTNIVLLGIVSFLNDLSSEMIMPILDGPKAIEHIVEFSVGGIRQYLKKKTE